MSSKKEEERNEKIIRGLLKLPPNRRCINCNSMVIPSFHFALMHLQFVTNKTSIAVNCYQIANVLHFRSVSLIL